MGKFRQVLEEILSRWCLGIVVSQEKNEGLRLLLAVLCRAAETRKMYEWIARQRKLRRLTSGLLGIGE